MEESNDDSHNPFDGLERVLKIVSAWPFSVKLFWELCEFVSSSRIEADRDTRLSRVRLFARRKKLSMSSINKWLQPYKIESDTALIRQVFDPAKSFVDLRMALLRSKKP